MSLVTNGGVMQMVAAALTALALAGCGKRVQGAVAEEPAPVCAVVLIDGSASYLYASHALRIAADLVQALPGGSKLYVRWITADSSADTSAAFSLALPVTGPAPVNPFDARAKTAHRAALAHDQQLRRGAVKRLFALVSPKAPMTDVYGSLYAAGVRFGTNGDAHPLLVLFSDMRDNVRSQLSADLGGAVVVVMGYQTGDDDEKHRAYWEELLAKRGASSVEFLPVDEPLPVRRLM